MNNIVDFIRKRQEEIIVMVNSSFDEIVKEVSRIRETGNSTISDFEVIYPLSNSAGFKGRKVNAVFINEKRILTPTWKKVFEEIIKDAMKDDVKKNKLHELSDKLLGHKRTRLSSSSDEMRSPIKIDDDLYVETHYDTETLINLLLQILNKISYDYSNVKIAVNN